MWPLSMHCSGLLNVVVTLSTGVIRELQSSLQHDL